MDDFSVQKYKKIKSVPWLKKSRKIDERIVGDNPDTTHILENKSNTKLREIFNNMDYNSPEGN